MEKLKNHPMYKILLNNDENNKLEYTKKIVKNEIFSDRINMLLDNSKESFLKCIRFLDEANLLQGYNCEYMELMKYFYSHTKLINARYYAIGFDIRENIHETRVKFWTEFISNESVYDLLTEDYNIDKSLKKYMQNNKFLVGVDFYSDKSHKIKLYLHYSNLTHENKYNLSGLIGENVVEMLIKVNSFFYIGFKNDFKDIFLYISNNVGIYKLFSIFDLQLQNDKLLFHKGIEPHGIGVQLSDILNKELSNYNLYYYLD